MGHSLDPNRAVMTVTEASAASGFTRAHINYLINRDLLEAVKVGAVWLVYEDSLRRYLALPRKPGPKPRDLTGSLADMSMPGSEG